MIENIVAESKDGDVLTVRISSDREHVVVGIDEGAGFAIFRLTPTQTDDLIRALGTARVELSKARP